MFAALVPPPDCTPVHLCVLFWEFYSGKFDLGHGGFFERYSCVVQRIVFCSNYKELT